MKRLIAGVLVSLTLLSGAGSTVTDRYEFRCDRIEHNYDIGVDYAVVEIYDTQTEEITMVDIALQK